MGTLRAYRSTFLIASRSVLLGMREMFQAKVVEIMKAHFLCSVTFFSKIMPVMK